jgi:PAS domain S-box-containing protein
VSGSASLIRRLTIGLLLVAVYVTAGRLGLAFAVVNASATAIWPPTGIALAAVLIFGARAAWPAIFIGAFLTNETNAGSVATSLLIATGNTLEAVVGGYLVGRFAGGRAALDSGRNIFLFIVGAAIVSPALGATVGVTSLSLLGFVAPDVMPEVWLTWWLGDAAGVLLVAPLFLLWNVAPLTEPAPRRTGELLLFASLIVVGGWFVFVATEYPVAFLCIPLSVWAAYRIGRREAAVGILVLSLIALWGTVHGVGTFARDSRNDALLLLQAFMAVTSIVALVVGAAVAGRRRAEEALRRSYRNLESTVVERTFEREAALERLRISDALYAESQHDANIGNWQWTPADNSKIWSDELYRIYGFEPRSFSPSVERFFELLHPDDRERVSGSIRHAAETHEPFEFEYRVIRLDGAVRTLRARGRVIVDEDGRVVRMLGTAQDISARKSAEDVRSHSEERLRTIIEAEPACVKLVSPDGRLLEMNRAGLDMLGADDVTPLLGQPVVDLVHPADREQYLALHQAASRGTSGRSEFRMMPLSGGERWVDSRSVPFPMRAETGGVSAVLSVTGDVTERKLLEQQLRQSQRLEAVGQLAGGVAHDFNNLLTAILGFCDLGMSRLSSRHAAHADLREIRSAADRAVAVTQQLLAFSRKQILRPRVLDVNDAVGRMLTLLPRLMGEDIHISTRLDPELLHVRADPTQLEQVLLNLAVNARDAMPHGGSLRVHTCNIHLDTPPVAQAHVFEPGPYVALTVSDTGSGMDEQTRSRVFEPFFTTKDTGTGLGLATVYGIVKQSRGFIVVDSEPQRGSAFTIYLPATTAPVEEAPAAATAAPATAGTATILVVEDEASVRNFIRRTLELSGYTVLQASDGHEALTICLSGVAVDVLLTDMIMPGISGRQVAAEFRRANPAVRILFMSGYSEETLAMRAAGEPGPPLLQKPFGTTQLVAAIRELLNAPPA